MFLIQDEPEGGGSACWELIVSVHTGQKVSLEQIRAFLEASDEVRFEARDRGEVYAWVERTLREQGWTGLGRASRGLVRRYLAKMTGLSRAQITRLIKQYTEGEAIKPKLYRRQPVYQAVQPIGYRTAGERG